MSDIDYAKRNEGLLLKRDVTPNAYQRGFEDLAYMHRYANPFPLGGEDWRQYCAGNEDARAEARQERI